MKLHDRVTFPQFVHEFNLWPDFHSDSLPPRGSQAPYFSIFTLVRGSRLSIKKPKGGSSELSFFCIIKSNLEHLHLNLWTV